MNILPHLTVRGLAAALALALVTTPAAAQRLGGAAQDQLRSADARLEGRLDPDTRRAVVAVIDSALGDGLLPELTDRLVSRALRGAQQGASADVVLDVVRGHARLLIAARQALGSATLVEIDAAAEALRKGIPPAMLSDLRSMRPRGSLAVPLVVLVDLVVRGVPSDTATHLILALAERQATDAVYNSLRLAVADDIGAGTLPIVAAATRTRGYLGAGAGASTAAEAADRVTTGNLSSTTPPRTRPPAPPPPP